MLKANSADHSKYVKVEFQNKTQFLVFVNGLRNADDMSVLIESIKKGDSQVVAKYALNLWSFVAGFNLVTEGDMYTSQFKKISLKIYIAKHLKKNRQEFETDALALFTKSFVDLDEVMLKTSTKQAKSRKFVNGSTCLCGKEVSLTLEHAQHRAVRFELDNEGHKMNAYPCMMVPNVFHIGHAEVTRAAQSVCIGDVNKRHMVQVSFSNGTRFFVLTRYQDVKEMDRIADLILKGEAIIIGKMKHQDAHGWEVKSKLLRDEVNTATSKEVNALHYLIKRYQRAANRIKYEQQWLELFKEAFNVTTAEMVEDFVTNPNSISEELMPIEVIKKEKVVEIPTKEESMFYTTAPIKAMVLSGVTGKSYHTSASCGMITKTGDEIVTVDASMITKMKSCKRCAGKVDVFVPIANEPTVESTVRARIDDLESQNYALRATIDKLNNELADRDSKIAVLKSKLDESAITCDELVEKMEKELVAWSQDETLNDAFIGAAFRVIRVMKSYNNKEEK